MNLYIINKVLYDYTAGMCVIAAESMGRCEQLFMKEFGWHDNDLYNQSLQNQSLQKEFNEAPIKVIENINHPEGIVSYVYGGG
jgi:hypothetical protein